MCDTLTRMFKAALLLGMGASLGVMLSALTVEIVLIGSAQANSEARLLVVEQVVKTHSAWIKSVNERSH